MAQQKKLGLGFIGPMPWPSDHSENELPIQLYNIEQIASRLADIDRLAQPGASVLEVGCYVGGSLQRWANVLMRIGSKRKLIAVDPLENQGGYLRDERFNGDMNLFERSIRDILEFYGNGEFHRLRSDDFFASYAGGGLAFVLVDGWHEEEQMRRDIENCAKYMAPNGLLVIDDVSRVDGFDEWILDRFKDHKIEWLPGNQPGRELAEKHQALVYFQ
jgi:SAM-dependent methyltransferase